MVLVLLSAPSVASDQFVRGGPWRIGVAGGTGEPMDHLNYLKLEETSDGCGFIDYMFTDNWGVEVKMARIWESYQSPVYRSKAETYTFTIGPKLETGWTRLRISCPVNAGVAFIDSNYSYPYIGVAGGAWQWLWDRHDRSYTGLRLESGVGVELFLSRRLILYLEPFHLGFTLSDITLGEFSFKGGLKLALGNKSDGAPEGQQSDATRPNEKPEKAQRITSEPPVTVRPVGKRSNVAVADLSAQGVSASDAAVMSDLIRNELMKTKAFTVLERSNMEKLLAETAFQQTGCTSEECAIKLGKLLNVQRMVVGSFGKLISTYVLSVRMVDVQTGAVVFSDVVKGKNEDELSDRLGELAGRMANVQ